MATDVTFSTMLNQYVTIELLEEEAMKRSWVLANVQRDDNWLGSDLIVPFRGNQASSVQFGALVGGTDIAQDGYVRGSITTQPELWGAMFFNAKDIVQHNKLSVQNFLKVLPDTIDQFMDYFAANVLAHSFLNGPSFAKVTDATNAATGIMVVDRIERFELSEKASLDDDDSVAVDVYVTAINTNTNSVTLSLTRGGGAANLSAYSVAQNAKFYFPGSQTAGMTSLKSALLPLSAGGSTTLYGQTKTAYPFLQAIAGDGSSITASNILDSIFDHYVVTQQKGKGMPTKVLMSYKNGGAILKLLEVGKGSFHQDPKSTKTSVYGWTEIDIYGPAGMLTVVMDRGMDDDWIGFLDVRPTVMKIYSNGFIRRQKNPDGNEFYTQRATTGYTYIVDQYFMGDFVLQRPSTCGVLHSISY